MLDYDELFSLPLFGLGEEQKNSLYVRWLDELGSHHRKMCSAYAEMEAVLGHNFALPVRLFKEYDLRSVDLDEVAKTMTSSGTTSQAKSRIFLDGATSSRQTKALSRIVADFVGTSKRVPMLVIDAPGTVEDRTMFSARTAGVRGFSMFGRDVTFALDNDMNLDFESIKAFQERHKGERVMLFGFTFMVWKHFIQALETNGDHLELRGLLIHGGGWKKLASDAVDQAEFNAHVKEVTGLDRVSDYYGMVEQTGSIYMECERGHLHASIFSDISAIDPLTMRELPIGERGLLKTISLLPTSYPGHILLTEDEGCVLGIDDCECGRKGRYFKVFGRMPGAEIRGCSDTYEHR